ncbi:MAG: Carrier protein [Magnetococcales bacterium]|nr:Carrier protein [Magnetococcales bacterium]
MNDSIIIEKIKLVIKEELSLEHISDSASQDNVPQWDSMAFMSIVAKLEDTFGILVTADNVVLFDSIEKIFGEIKRQLSCKES